MPSGSFFIQRPEVALRHLNYLSNGLKKLAIAGWIGGASCSAMAVVLTHFLAPPPTQSSAMPGVREMSGIVFVAWFMASALLLFSTFYFIAGWSLSQRKAWARYTGATAFVFKVLLCVWLGRGSIGAMIVFLLIAGWDFYGLWVLLSKETGQIFASPEQFAASVRNEHAQPLFNPPTTKARRA